MRKRRNGKFVLLLAAAGLFSLSPGQVLGAESQHSSAESQYGLANNQYRLGASREQGDEPYLAMDGNQVTDEELQDNVIEYRELGSLIHAYNSSVQEVTDSTSRSRSDYTSMQDALRVAEGDAEWAQERAEDEGDAEAYMEETSNRMIYKSAIRSYNNMLDSLDDYSSAKSLRTLEKQLTNSAQSLMISYQSLRNEKEASQKMLELYQAMYENAQTELAAGLGTEQAVVSAYTSCLSAQISLESLDASLASVYQSLCHLLGVDEDGSMEMAEIPQPELEKISQMDLAADTALAISSNIDIISERSASTDGSTTDGERKNRAIDELKSKVTIGMEELYHQVLEAKTAYDAAETGLSSAKITWENAQRKYSMGMLSRAEYLQAESSYLQKESAFKAAGLSLFQTMENYSWGANGVMELS